MFLVQSIGAAARSFQSPMRLLFLILAVMVMVVAGPFSTLTQLGLFDRALYWGVIVVASSFIAQVVIGCVAHLLPGASATQCLLAQAAGMGLLFSPVGYGWTLVMVQAIDARIIPFYIFVLDVVLISLAIFTARYLLMNRATRARFEQSESGAVPRFDEATPPRLMRRIDTDDPGPILRLEALDHFVTAVTAQGHYQLRMRFADAWMRWMPLRV